ncbi:conserved hypothetical protein [Oceanicaulis sp. 350]|jgi:hypothetical protein|nr:hypothetical protein [Oceanicaulis sp.]VXD01352.1 conserved hypothetical protein [Oceanicaulis sp. 350]|tara:strand:- start:347 stop:487 length:141 start_codon:yes stop_codon:yes gene_type:complete
MEALNEYGSLLVEIDQEDFFCITDCVDLAISEATLDDAGETLAQAS